MPKKLGANLYKDAALWPVIPPWWLLSSPQAAALINTSPATLHYWRTRGEGPAAVAPLFLRPTQGQPVFYLYGTLRSWAAQRVGIQYLFDDQCYDFLCARAAWLGNGKNVLPLRAKLFDRDFETDRQNLRLGKELRFFSNAHVIELDSFYATQPRWRRISAKYEWVGTEAAHGVNQVRTN